MRQVPVFLKALGEKDPQFAERVMEVMGMAFGGGALDAKTKTLMSLLGDAVLGHFEGVAALAARARQEGASEGEIAETVRMAFMVGGLPGLVTGLRAFGG
jgi:alkylhydroperoxidase/carboxymuconolactone decarboxylase family protein YurZ